jgi:hypothetical protein
MIGAGLDVHVKSISWPEVIADLRSPEFHAVEPNQNDARGFTVQRILKPCYEELDLLDLDVSRGLISGRQEGRRQ